MRERGKEKRRWGGRRPEEWKDTCKQRGMDMVCVRLECRLTLLSSLPHHQTAVQSDV